MASNEKQDKQPNSSRKVKPIPVDPNLKSSGKVGDWVRHVSASAGKEYYYNITTSNSQWEKPNEWVVFEDKYGSVPHELVPFSDLLTVENSVTTTNTKVPQAKNENTVIQSDTMGYKKNKATPKAASPDLEILKDVRKELRTKESGDDREQAIRQLYDQAARLGIKLPTFELNLKINQDLPPITNETLETSGRETNRAISQANLKLTSNYSKEEITCLDSNLMKSDELREPPYSKSGPAAFSCVSSTKTKLEKLEKERVPEIPKKKNAEVKCDHYNSSKRSKCEIPKPISKSFAHNLSDLRISPPTPDSLGQDLSTSSRWENEELHSKKKGQHQAVKSINKKPANPYSSPTAPIRTRPPGLENKRGSIGETVNLVVNYFPIRMLESGWEMFHYTVYFNPDEQVGRIRKQLLAQYETLFGVYMFDGCNLYTLSSLENCPIVLYAALKKNHAEIGDGSQVVEITIKSRSKIKPEDPFYYKFWSYFVHHAITKCLKLDKIGSNYFNLGETLSLGVTHRVEVCPGYTIKIRDYEAGLMLNVGFVHKVIRSENCLQVLKTFRHQSDARREFVGTTVMTRYNQRTYKIYRVDWSKNPLYKFEWKGTWCSIKDYYKKKYGIEIKDSKQPLFVSLSTKNSTENENTLLVPELCQPVGLKQHQRKDHQLKRDLGNILHSNPDKRLRSMQEFVKRLTECLEFQTLMDSWRLSLDNNFATISSRVVPEEQVVLRFNGQRVSFPVGRKTDWRFPFLDHQMLTTKCLNHWAVLTHERDIQEWDLFLCAMRCAGKPAFHISNPIVIKLYNERKSTYLKVLEKTLTEHPNLEMVLLIIPNFEHGLYSALKRKLYVDHGIPSQCLLSKSLADQGRNRTIIEKLLIQMNVKLGGEAWGCNNPLKRSHTMVVGYSESGPNKEGIKIGAVVATTNSFFSCYYSTSSTYSKSEENNRTLSSDLIKCIQAYRYKNNNILPDRILLYRQTSGYQKELAFINNIELQDLKSNLHSYYVQCGHKPARFSMILVSRKPNTRFADAENPHRFSNPISGTVVDSVITLPELYDFYLVSAAPKDHFVIPTNYNVIYDQQDLLPDQLQRLTYKLCYLYYNRTGPVHLPAMCLYAKRLAQLTVSMGYVHVKDEKLKHTLFYL